MKTRLLVVLLSLGGLTAFAPAPFPKPGPRTPSDAVTLTTLQGDWKAISFDQIGPNGQLSNVLWFQGVRVQKDRWHYLVSGQERQSFRIVVNGSRRPSAI